LLLAKPQQVVVQQFIYVREVVALNIIIRVLVKA
jgi:hypothetical protein